MMKKLLLLGMGLFISFSAATAQDTLLYEDFNDSIGLPPIFAFGNVQYPNAILGDTIWTNYDQDQLPDGSGGGRPDEWFWTFPYVTADSAAHSSCFAGNSWTNDFANPIANWLITPSIQIVDALGNLSWFSASRQTPYYLDGYAVLVSTSNNDLPNFTDTLFVASEYDDESGAYINHGSNFANYVFTPAGGFVHGMDLTYITDEAGTGDSSRWAGVLRPFTVSLAAYSGMDIYIAFKHNSHDDNILYLDDILVTGTMPNAIEELPDFAVSVYPNPCTDFVNVNIDINKYHNANVQLMNNSGQMIYTSPLVTQNHKINLQNMASGVYYVKILCDEGNIVKKLIVTK